MKKPNHGIKDVCKISTWTLRFSRIVIEFIDKKEKMIQVPHNLVAKNHKYLLSSSCSVS